MDFAFEAQKKRTEEQAEAAPKEAPEGRKVSFLGNVRSVVIDREI